MTARSKGAAASSAQTAPAVSSRMQSVSCAASRQNAQPKRTVSAMASTLPSGTNTAGASPVSAINSPESAESSPAAAASSAAAHTAAANIRTSANPSSLRRRSAATTAASRHSAVILSRTSIA